MKRLIVALVIALPMFASAQTQSTQTIIQQERADNAQRQAQSFYRSADVRERDEARLKRAEDRSANVLADLRGESLLDNGERNCDYRTAAGTEISLQTPDASCPAKMKYEVATKKLFLLDK